MTVQDIVTQLKYGELRSIAVKDDVPAIISYMNLALIQLYGRFKLARAEQIIDLDDNISVYDLNTDVMIVDEVYNEVGELALNDDDNLFGAFLPTYNTIQIPNPATGTQVSVIYVQNPVSLVVDADEAVTLAQNVPLPVQLMEPFLHYIGYRAHGSMDGNIKAENNTHYMRYEASVKRIKDLGLIREDVIVASVSQKEGWIDEEN